MTDTTPSNDDAQAATDEGPATETKAESAATPEKPARNPVERAIVWGLILILLVVVGVEGFAWSNFNRSLSAVQAAITDAEANDSNLKLDDVANLIAGTPKVSTASHSISDVNSYEYSGLLRSRTFHVEYGRRSGIVYQAYPEGVERLEPREQDDSVADSSDDEMAESGGGGAPMHDAYMSGDGAGPPQAGSQGGGGRGRFDPMQFDADQDGKLSREEAPERMQENFEAIDADSDGSATAEEIQSFFAARRAERGGPGGGEGGRPRRPAAEEDSEADSSGESSEGAPDSDS